MSSCFGPCLGMRSSLFRVDEYGRRVLVYQSGLDVSRTLHWMVSKWSRALV